MASIPKDPFAKPLLYGGLALLAAALFVLVANLFTTIEKNSTVVGAEDTIRIEKTAQKNLDPIGSVVAVDKSVAPIARTGEQVYNAVCTACHAAGVLEAPKLEKAAWTERAAKGLKSLVTSAINGLNAMPARGGDPSLTDEEMQDAVLHMTGKAGLDLTADAGAKTETAPAEKTAEAAPATEQKAAPETPAQAEVPAKEAAPAAQVATTAPAPAAPAVQTAASHSGIDGQKIYQSICFSCHDSGVAGSPKPGDKAVWAPRIATGMPAIYDSVLKGKGAMPAKGGNPALSDDDIKAAVDWMIAESQ